MNDLIELNSLQIATIVFSRHNRLQFDPHWLSNFTEPFVCDSTVDEISPLVTNPGRLLLTTRCVYFQPYNNILPVRKSSVFVFALYYFQNICVHLFECKVFSNK